MPLIDSLTKNLPDFPKHLGLTYIDVTPDRVVAAMTVREDLSNGIGTLHGGALMAFADTLGAVATMLNIPRDAKTTTLESKTNFIAAAPIGTRLIGEALPLHRGRRTQIWETRVSTEDGRLIAKVTQTQLIL